MVDWEGLYLGFKLREAHAKNSCATKEDPTQTAKTCPVKEAGEVSETLKSFSL